jgi:hypothetical protein
MKVRFFIVRIPSNRPKSVFDVMKNLTLLLKRAPFDFGRY